MKYFILLVPYLLISSCYVYSPAKTYDVIMYTDVSTKEILTIGDKMPAVKTKPPCKDPYVGNLASPPKLPSADEIMSAADQKALDNLLKRYIEALKKHNKYQSDVIQKYRQILKEC